MDLYKFQIQQSRRRTRHCKRCAVVPLATSEAQYLHYKKVAEENTAWQDSKKSELAGQLENLLNVVEPKFRVVKEAKQWAQNDKIEVWLKVKESNAVENKGKFERFLKQTKKFSIEQLNGLEKDLKEAQKYIKENIGSAEDLLPFIRKLSGHSSYFANLVSLYEFVKGEYTAEHTTEHNLGFKFHIFGDSELNLGPDIMFDKRFGYPWQYEDVRTLKSNEKTRKLWDSLRNLDREFKKNQNQPTYLINRQKNYVGTTLESDFKEELKDWIAVVQDNTAVGFVSIQTKIFKDGTDENSELNEKLAALHGTKIFYIDKWFMNKTAVTQPGIGKKVLDAGLWMKTQQNPNFQDAPVCCMTLQKNLDAMTRFMNYADGDKKKMPFSFAFKDEFRMMLSLANMSDKDTKSLMNEKKRMFDFAGGYYDFKDYVTLCLVDSMGPDTTLVHDKKSPNWSISDELNMFIRFKNWYLSDSKNGNRVLNQKTADFKKMDSEIKDLLQPNLDKTASQLFDLLQDHFLKHCQAEIAMGLDYYQKNGGKQEWIDRYQAFQKDLDKIKVSEAPPTPGVIGQVGGFLQNLAGALIAPATPRPEPPPEEEKPPEEETPAEEERPPEEGPIRAKLFGKERELDKGYWAWEIAYDFSLQKEEEYVDAFMTYIVASNSMTMDTLNQENNTARMDANKKNGAEPNQGCVTSYVAVKPSIKNKGLLLNLINDNYLLSLGPAFDRKWTLYVNDWMKFIKENLGDSDDAKKLKKEFKKELDLEWTQQNIHPFVCKSNIKVLFSDQLCPTDEKSLIWLRKTLAPTWIADDEKKMMQERENGEFYITDNMLYMKRNSKVLEIQDSNSFKKGRRTEISRVDRKTRENKTIVQNKMKQAQQKYLHVLEANQINAGSTETVTKLIGDLKTPINI